MVTAVLWVLLCRIAGTALFLEETSDHDHPAEEKHKRLLGDPSAHTDKPTRSENLVCAARAAFPRRMCSGWDQPLTAHGLMELDEYHSSGVVLRVAAARSLSSLTVGRAPPDLYCNAMSRWASCGYAQLWDCCGASWASSARTPSLSTCTGAPTDATCHMLC